MYDFYAKRRKRFFFKSTSSLQKWPPNVFLTFWIWKNFPKLSRFLRKKKKIFFAAIISFWGKRPKRFFLKFSNWLKIIFFKQFFHYGPKLLKRFLFFQFTTTVDVECSNTENGFRKQLRFLEKKEKYIFWRRIFHFDAQRLHDFFTWPLQQKTVSKNPLEWFVKKNNKTIVDK